MLDLTFVESHRLRPTSLLGPGFVDVDLDVAHAAPRTPGLVRATTGPVAPYAVVQVRASAWTGTGRGSIAAGLGSPDGDAVLVRRTRRSVVIEIRTQGRTRLLRRRRLPAAGTCGVAFALCENQVTALVDEGAGWRPVLSERAGIRRHLDLRREDVLARFRYAWEGDQAVLEQVRAGVFGGVGLRDPHLVQHSDGTPYERDGRVFLTWTAAGLGHFTQAHWTVWSADPSSFADLRLEAHLFFRRDGLILGDHAGQLVRHDGRWLVAVSSWGEFDERRVGVRHTRSDQDLLHGVHLLDTRPVALPTPYAAWDPALVRRDGVWHVAFVESPSQAPFVFHPALARTSATDWTRELGLEMRAASVHEHCEGPVLVEHEGRLWLLASDGDTRRYPVFDLEGRHHGSLDAPYPTNIPHPQVVPDPRGGQWLVTFDGTSTTADPLGYGGHGDVVVMHTR